MNNWWAIRRQNELKELRNSTNQFISELESILDNFEKNGDVKELGSKLKDSIKQFKNEA